MPTMRAVLNRRHQVGRLMNPPLNDSVASASAGSELDENGNMQDVKINILHHQYVDLERRDLQQL